MEDITAYSAAPTNYANFGRRFVAFIIDYLILGTAQFIIISPLLAMLGIGVASNVKSLENMDETQALGMTSAIMGASAVIQLVSLLAGAAYFILMESSEKQGTVGKIAMGIKVTDLNGAQITRMAAFIRYIGRIISIVILFIGYIMAAFTEKKQALHDMIANTLVLRK